MTLLERYLNYLSQICEGSRKAPDGITLTKTGDMEKAIELQQQIAAIGIPEFVRLCAAQDGETIPEEELATFEEAGACGKASTPRRCSRRSPIWKLRRKVQRSSRKRKCPRSRKHP